MNISMLCFFEQSSENFTVPRHLEPRNVVLYEDNSTHVADPSLCKHEEDLTALANSFSPPMLITLSNQAFNDFEVILRLCVVNVVVTVLLPVEEVVQGVLRNIVRSACFQQFINLGSFGLRVFLILVVHLILYLVQKELSELWHVEVANCDRFAHESAFVIFDSLDEHEFDALGQYSVGELLVFICQILLLLHKLLIVRVL